MTDSYRRFKRKAREELEAFKQERGFRAYTDETYREGLARLGISPEDADKVLTENPIGEYTITAKIPEIEAEEQEIEALKRRLIEADPDGSNFVYEMFLNENLDAGFRYYIDEDDENQEPWGDRAITVTGLTPEEVKQDPKLTNGLNLALDILRHWDPCEGYRRIWNARAKEYCNLGADEYESEAYKAITAKYDTQIRKEIDHDIDGSGFIRGMILFEGKEYLETLARLGYPEDTAETDTRFKIAHALAEYLRARDW